MSEETQAAATSTIDMEKWRKSEEHRINDARHRLLSGILAACENSELCNTLWNDEAIHEIRADVRDLVSGWLKELNETNKNLQVGRI